MVYDEYNIDIREFNRKEYYRIFSVVFQEIKIFTYPAAENIALTESPLIERELLAESLKKAGHLLRNCHREDLGRLP